MLKLKVAEHSLIPVETPKIEAPAAPIVSTEIKRVVAKTMEPIGVPKKVSLFSINAALEKAEETPEFKKATIKEKLPSQHFTETDLQTEWNIFLKDIQKRDALGYNAINSFQLRKKEENIVEVTYPSESAKGEFEKIRSEFFNHFMHKVNHYNISIEYKVDLTMKKEIITKRKIFDKFAEINPVLRDLDDVFKLDFN